MLDSASSIIIDFLEDSFCYGYKLSLECLVRLFATVHETYVFEEVKRTQSFDDIYDVGNLLMLVVHHAITLAVRRPDTASLMIEDNLKIMYRMFAIESKVNQILDINSLYLSWLLMRERKKDFDKRIIKLQYIASDGHIFIKNIAQYLLEVEFDVSEFADLPDSKKFFLEDLIAEKLFGPFLSLDLSPIAESDDYLDSIFIWEYYKGNVDSIEYLILKCIMILHVYNEVLSVIQDIVDMFRLSYGQPTSRNIARIIHDSMVKICLKIIRMIKRNKFESFSSKIKKLSPATVDMVKELLIGILDKLRDLGKETAFIGAILHYANKEAVDISMSRVLTSSLVARIELTGVAKLQQDFMDDLGKMKSIFLEVTFTK